MAWIIATKLEMTRVVKGDRLLPITLLKVPELRVVWFKTKEIDDYDAIIIWVLKNSAETLLAEWKATLNKDLFIKIKEFPVSEKEIDAYEIWSVVSLDMIAEGVEVSLEWISKWKWFSWAMKRHNFHWGPAWHGSKFHRALGSIGNRKPTRTHKGKKMHWHQGDAKITLKKVPVELINKELSVLWVRWAVPGARNSYVNIIF